MHDSSSKQTFKYFQTYDTSHIQATPKFSTWTSEYHSHHAPIHWRNFLKNMKIQDNHLPEVWSNSREFAKETEKIEP